MPGGRVRANASIRSFSDLGGHRTEQPATRVVDLALAGCIFVVPWLMGGQHPLGQALLVALAVTAAGAWALGQASLPVAPFRPTWAAWLLLAGVGVLVVQIVPLPEWLLERLSPKITELLPLWHSQGNASAQCGIWQTLSLTPTATRDGLILLSAYLLLFVVIVHRIDRVEEVERLLRWTGSAAALMAIFGLVQYFTNNGKFFWFYEHPYRTTADVVKGSFTNHNHFAEFLALGTGPLLWWVQEGFRKRRAHHGKAPAAFGVPRSDHDLKTYLSALGLTLVVFAGLLSLSRGGTAAILLAVSVSGALCWRAAAGRSGLVTILAAVGVLVAISLNVFGLDRVTPRIEELQSCSAERLDSKRARRSIWTATGRAISQFPLLGSGVGSPVEVYPIYYSSDLWEESGEFTYAESSYLQMGLETGSVGLILLFAGIACCGFWCVGGLLRSQSSRVTACLGAVTGGLVATAAHAAVDFVWYIPACTVMIVVLVACAARLWQFSKCPVPHGSKATVAPWQERPPHGRSSPKAAGDSRGVWMLPRFAYLGAAAILVPAGAWMMKSQVQAVLAEPAWEDYCKSRTALTKELERRPEALDTAGAPAAQQAEQQRIDELETVVRWLPDHRRAHLDLAECYLRLFDMLQSQSENPMSLANLRDAALRSRFPSREALGAWLGRAVGPHVHYLDEALRHVRCSLALCPVQGRAYVYLAELCFLENAGEEGKGACIDQALRVRPFNGEVLYAGAREALLAGDYDRWLTLARQSFQAGRRQQRRLITDLISRTPPEGLEEMIRMVVREFQPDLTALRTLYLRAQQRGQPEQLVWLRHRCAEQAEADARLTRGEAAAELWNEARKFYAANQDGDRAFECAKNAVASDPNDFAARYGFGLALLEQGQPEEAESHLRWCLQRRPNDAAAEAKWKEAIRRRLDREHETATRKNDRRYTY